MKSTSSTNKALADLLAAGKADRAAIKATADKAIAIKTEYP